MTQTQLVLPDGPLYKYLSVDEHQSPSWAERLQQLLEGKMFLPSPLDFNDPFDCSPFVSIPESGDEVAAQTGRFAKRMAAALAMPEDAVEATLQEKLPGLSISDLNDVVRASISKTSGEIGVFCLAAEILNVLMWSHYSSNHRGFAVRFDLRRNLHCGLLPLDPVVYQQERPDLGNIFTGLDHDRIPRALATKAAFWSYENEWRLIRAKAARTVLKFDPNVITGIVFGARCPPAVREQVAQRVSGMSLELLEIGLSPRTFELEVKYLGG